MTATVEEPSARSRAPIGPKVVLNLVAGITGAAGLIYEYLLATTSSYLMGDSINQFSITIGLMMLMMGIGGWAQQKIPDRTQIGAFIGVELALCLMGAFAPIANILAFAKLEDHYQLVEYAFIMSIGLAIGLEIPLAVRINERFEQVLKVNLAIIGADYAGAFVGCLIWVNLLKHMVPLTEMSFWIAGSNLFVAALCFSYFWYKGLIRNRRGRTVGVVALGAVLAILITSVLSVGGWTISANQDLYQDPIAFQITTPYQNIVITHRTNPDDVRLYLNGNTQFSSTDEFIYHESMVHPAMNLGPHGNVLILGGGDGLVLREVEKYPDVKSITLVDLDPEMIHLAKTYPLLTALNDNSFKNARVSTQIPSGVQKTSATAPVMKDTKDKVENPDGTFDWVTRQIATVHVYNVDAFQFVRARPGTYDTVFIDLPDPNSIELAKLYSQQFYAMVHSVMTPNGIMVVQSGSPFHAREAYVCDLETIKSAGFAVLPYHTNVPSFGDWGWTLAWANPHTNPLAEVQQKIAPLKTWPVPTRWLVNGASFTADLNFGKGELDPTDIGNSTLENPAILQYYVGDGWKMDP